MMRAVPRLLDERHVQFLLRANAAVGLGFGIGLLIVPRLLLGLYGFSLDGADLVPARLYGAELLGFNVATWLAAAQAYRGARPAIVIGHVFNEAIGALVTVVSLLAGLGNGLAWSVVGLQVAFAAGFIAVLSGPRDLWA
jgi:hypothetical protein